MFHVDVTVLKAKTMLQTSTYESKKKAWKGGKYISYLVKYHIILKNLEEYGCQELYPWMKVNLIFNGIRCDKMSTAAATTKEHPDKYDVL